MILLLKWKKMNNKVRFFSNFLHLKFNKMTISIKNIIPFLFFAFYSLNVFAQPDLPSEEIEVIKDFEAAQELRSKYANQR